jgi:DNA-binding transcriptional LysR family regulator
MADFNVNHIRKFDGGLLLVFRELLRRRRATEVGRHLGLSQSGVSHALTRLRELFGDPLFIRRPHGLEPTRRALELGPRIDALIDMVGVAIGRGAGFDPAASERRFNVAAPEFVGAQIGGRLISTLRERAPHASLALGFMGQDNALDALRRGELDVALGRFGAAPPDVRVELLYEDRYCVVARRDHPKIKGAIELEAYSKTGHIFAYSLGEGAVGERLPPPQEVAMTALVPYWSTALALVSATEAIATCPRRTAETYAPIYGLQILETSMEMWPVKVFMARRAEGGDEGADWFAGMVRECATT